MAAEAVPEQSLALRSCRPPAVPSAARRSMEADMLRSAYSLIELLVCVALVLIVTFSGAPALMGARDSVRADSAADYLAGRLHAARVEALKRRASVAVRFEATASGDDYLVATYVDGNGNGVRAADITAGVDVQLRAAECVADQFPNVHFGFEGGVSDVNGTSTASDPDPIRVGSSRMLSFSPTGTSSSGTVYLRGRGRHQVAVRVLGGTGRVRSLAYDFVTGQWLQR
jgi:Tfp pilus assembly protein FimT